MAQQQAGGPALHLQAEHVATLVTHQDTVALSTEGDTARLAEQSLLIYQTDHNNRSNFNVSNSNGELYIALLSMTEMIIEVCCA